MKCKERLQTASIFHFLAFKISLKLFKPPAKIIGILDVFSNCFKISKSKLQGIPQILST